MDGWQALGQYEGTAPFHAEMTYIAGQVYSVRPKDLKSPFPNLGPVDIDEVQFPSPRVGIVSGWDDWEPWMWRFQSWEILIISPK